VRVGDSGAPSAQAPVESVLVEVPTYRDARGTLVAVEVEDVVPFEVRRVFVVSAVPAGARRAEHANRTCAEALLAASGSLTVDVDDGWSVSSHRLDSPSRVLVVPAGQWLTCRDFSADAALVVLASAPYDPADQVTDYAEFLAARRG
jgi:UDP-2-acetamido-3-amino-2,3-dideoxy-glucuronate N-acetyltransferase